MKKTLLATALAVGFAGAAAAQTSVTLYGVADGGFGYTQFKDKNSAATSARASALSMATTGFDANGNPTSGSAVIILSNKAKRTGLYDGNQQGNRWGLRGSEDLGGGLKASFQLESGFSLATGNAGQGNRLFGRTAKLALGSDSWGEIAFGRQTNFASRYVADVVGVYDDAFAEGHIGATFTSTATVRYDNMITYETPSFSGFKFGVGYSFNTNGAQPWDINGQRDTDRDAWSTALRYANGPLVLAASYDIVKKVDANTGEKDVKSWALGASYDFDVARLHLGFGQDRDGVLSDRGPAGGIPSGLLVRDINGNPVLDASGNTQIVPIYFGQSGYTPAGYKTNNYSLGVAVPLEGSRISFNWQSARLGSSDYKTVVRATGGKNSQNLYSVVYTYDLSKRTNVYVFGTYGTGYAFNDVSVTQAVVGLRHRF